MTRRSISKEWNRLSISHPTLILMRVKGKYLDYPQSVKRVPTTTHHCPAPRLRVPETTGHEMTFAVRRQGTSRRGRDVDTTKHYRKRYHFRLLNICVTNCGGLVRIVPKKPSHLYWVRSCPSFGCSENEDLTHLLKSW